MTLPPLLVLTDRRASESAGRGLADTVSAAISGGARAVLLREKDLPADARAELGGRLAQLLAEVGGWLGVASDVRLARRLGTTWVHLAADDPAADDPDLLQGRSCHSAAELERACAVHLDYVTISPVYPTRSKPGYGPALGPGGLARLARLARRAGGPPVYALGGIRPDRVRACVAAGAAGVAVMGAVMGDDRPDRVVTALLAALPTDQEEPT